MTTKGKKLKATKARKVEPIAVEDIGKTFTEHWTRGEQIENAKEDGTAEDLAPPLTDAERAEYGL